jgi:hypothetical protein
VSIEDYLDELHSKLPEKCKTCELIFADFDFKKGGWEYKCETVPDCYQEPSVGGIKK